MMCLLLMLLLLLGKMPLLLTKRKHTKYKALFMGGRIAAHTTESKKCDHTNTNNSTGWKRPIERMWAVAVDAYFVMIFLFFFH